MSESMTADAPANSGTESSQPATESPASDYEGFIKQHGEENFEARDDDSYEDREPEEETPEGIPAKDTLKVNGKEITKPYSEIKEMAQKYSATEMKLETAKKEISEARQAKEQFAKREEAVRNLLAIIQKGDFETINEFASTTLGMGDNFNRAVIQYALKLYEQSKMTPEQKRAAENEKLISRYRQQEEERKRADEQRAFQYQVNQYEQHIAVELPKAIKQVGLPDNEFIREQVIITWRNAVEQGQTPTAAAVAAHVKDKLNKAKVSYSPPAAKPVTQPRPVATRQSTGRMQQQAETGYKSWDDWIKTRAR
jgi:hypothetical protein